MDLHNYSLKESLFLSFILQSEQQETSAKVLIKKLAGQHRYEGALFEPNVITSDNVQII